MSTENPVDKLVVEKINEILSKCKWDADERRAFERDMEGFKELFLAFHQKRRDKKDVIEWEKIKPPPASLIVPQADLPKATKADIESLSKKVCVLKLNGGLGTTMGCTGPKSVIEVRNELTFLDLTVLQLEVTKKNQSFQDVRNHFFAISESE